MLMNISVRSLYEINTATWLHELSKKHQQRINLASVPAEEWDTIARYGFDSVWLMGIWERSPAAIAINMTDHSFMQGMRAVLPDLNPERDIIGSAYSIRDYNVNANFGGPEALSAARFELKKRGIKLLLDFVPNHLAPDHAWTTLHPEYFIQGNEEDLKKHPTHFLKIGDSILARGRDPEFEPWSDVLQLNAFSPTLRNSVIDTIRSIADQSDGIRCDMAMLLLNKIFHKTWGERAGARPESEFWSEVITAVRKTHPNFLFIAETYWDTEAELLGLGFDYCYDKTLYDFMVENKPVNLKRHLSQDLNIQQRLVRFIENHDEPRAGKVFKDYRQLAAATLLTTVPGAHMYHDGQFDGLQKRIPVQLARSPEQLPDVQLHNFYRELLTVTQNVSPVSYWQLHDVSVRTLWHSRIAHTAIAYSWRSGGKQYIFVMNWSKKGVQASIDVADLHPSNIRVIFSTQTLSQKVMRLDKKELKIKLQAWQAAILELSS